MNTEQAPVPASLSAPQTNPAADPLVQAWFDRIKAAQKHWEKFHKRAEYNRKLVRGIDDSADPKSEKYNKKRANLIHSSLTVILSKVYAKNPEMTGSPTNKARDLKQFADTVTTVTQTMLEDAGLKKQAKRAVRAAMTASIGYVKVQYQRDMRTDPLIQKRIQDTQDNVLRIEQQIAAMEDDYNRGDLERQKAELQQTIAGLEAQVETVAAEGLIIDRVKTDRLLPDPAIEDIWDFESAGYMIECIPMRRSVAKGMFPDIAEELCHATIYRADSDGESPKQMYGGKVGNEGDDPLVMAYEAWHKLDNRIYTMVDGIQNKFARQPYSPQRLGERWWPYFALPFASVDGEFVGQSLVDALEKLEIEHNTVRDKLAAVRNENHPHWVASADLKAKDIQRRQIAGIGEVLAVDTQGQPVGNMFTQAQQLAIDPAQYDTTMISQDWEMVSGMQDASRSVVNKPKTATEASIMDQSLSARVGEFRDQVEDFLSDIAQYASELCLLNMTRQQVEQIMGPAKQGADGSMMPSYVWPEQATPESVFALIQLKVRAGSTSAPNKLEAQESWARALPMLQQMILAIRQIDMSGGDSSPERELVRETAARFDETIDVDRFLPPKPMAAQPIPGMPGMPPGAMPPGLPQPTLQ